MVAVMDSAVVVVVGGCDGRSGIGWRRSMWLWWRQWVVVLGCS